MENWDDLRFFLAVAQTSTVSAASQKLAVNQSTVSRHINEFEERLKVRLFDRLTTGYHLTPEGQSLYSHAVRIEEETLDIERLLMGKDTEPSGTIRITITHTFAQFLMMPIFAQFFHAYPNIELQVVASNDKLSITQREADVALRITSDSPPENLVGKVLGEIHYGIYGDRSYLERYHQSGLLHWIGEDNNDTYPSWLPALTTPLKLVMRSSDTLMSVEAIKLGLGIGRIPQWIGNAEPQLALFQPSLELPNRKLWILTHPDLLQVKRIQILIQFLSDQINDCLN